MLKSVEEGDAPEIVAVTVLKAASAASGIAQVAGVGTQTAIRSHFSSFQTLGVAGGAAGGVAGMELDETVRNGLKRQICNFGFHCNRL